MASEGPFCRLTVLAPRCRVDVALPADVPVAELVPMVLELVGEPDPGAPMAPQPWRLSGIGGGVLPLASTLGELGTLDGELLRIGPAVAPPPAPVFDDPVDALAATAGADRHGDRRLGGSAVVAIAGAAGALVAWPGARGSTIGVALGAVGAIGAVVCAAWLVRRPGSPAEQEVLFGAARTASLAAVVLAAAVGWAMLSPDPGPVAPTTALLLAATAAGMTAAVAQVLLRIIAPALVGVVVVSVLVATAAVSVRFGAAPTAAGAALAAVAVVAGPLLPRAALRLAGLPRPVVPADAGELVDADEGPDLLPPEELAERADLARGYLAGLAGAAAVVAAGGALVAATAGGWAGPAFAAVIVTVLGLRARGFADPVPARVLLGSAIAGAVGLAGAVVVAAGPAAGPSVEAALLGVAAVGTVALARTRPIASPVSRRAIDLFEGLLVAAAVPLAFGAMDLYRIVRGL